MNKKRGGLILKNAISDIYSLTGEEILASECLTKSRRADIVYQRAIISVYLRLQGYPLEEVGKILRLDHATVLYLTDKYEYKNAGSVYRKKFAEVKRILHKDNPERDSNELAKKMDLERQIRALRKELKKLIIEVDSYKVKKKKLEQRQKKNAPSQRAEIKKVKYPSSYNITEIDLKAIKKHKKKKKWKN